jgi:hypothetical protein
MTAKVKFKIEMIARMRVGGVSDAAICLHLGLSQSGLSRIVALPEYVQAENDIMTGAITQVDEALAGKTNEMREAFKVAVPAAMRTLIYAVTQKRDLRAALVASKEILDRDPDRTFATQKAGIESGNGAYSASAGVPAGILAAANSEAAKISASVGAPISVSPIDQNQN